MKITTTSTSTNNALIFKIKNEDKFYDCEYGYLYSNPSYYLFQSKCKIKENCCCVNCPDFKRKNII